MTLLDRMQAFFALNAANLSGENEKLVRTMCTNLNYTTMKEEAIKKLFPDISLLRYKNVSVVKEVKMIHFNHYKNANEKKSYQGIDGVNFSDEQCRLKFLNVKF